MKSIIYKTVSLVSMVFFVLPLTAIAIGGTCSSHQGVNCRIGPDVDGSAVCNDGWRDSSVRYYDVELCDDYLCSFQINLKETLSAEARESDAYKLGLIEYCEKIGMKDYPVFCAETRSKVIDEKIKLIEQYVSAARIFCEEPVTKKTCGSNEYLGSDNICYCNAGYLMKNGQCISYTEDCVQTYGEHVLGIKGQNNNSTCSCEADYEWNDRVTACKKKEVVQQDVSQRIVNPESPAHQEQKTIKQVDSTMDEVVERKDVVVKEPHVTEVESTKTYVIMTDDLGAEDEQIVQEDQSDNERVGGGSEQPKIVKEGVFKKIIIEPVKNLLSNIGQKISSIFNKVRNIF